MLKQGTFESFSLSLRARPASSLLRPKQKLHVLRFKEPGGHLHQNLPHGERDTHDCFSLGMGHEQSLHIPGVRLGMGPGIPEWKWMQTIRD